MPAPAVRSAVRHALLAVTAVGTVLAVLLGVTMAYVVRRHDRESALGRAHEVAVKLSNDVLGPRLDSAAPPAVYVPLLDTLLGTRAQDGSIVRIKVWTPDGVVLWADDHRLIGQRYELAPEDRALVGTRQAYAVMADLDKPENVYESALEGDFIEVYAGFFDNRGRPLVFEAYRPVGELGSSPLSAGIVGVSLVWLGLLMALVLPVAVPLARRVDRAQAKEQRLLAHAVEASELERKRLAQDLHDGVIQDLAGLSYAFAALESQLRDDPVALLTAQRASEIVRRDVMALRTLSTDLYPPDLSGEGLEPALEDMLDQCEQQGIETALHLSGPLALAPPTAMLAYRVVREALRNVVKHAQANCVRVDVERHAGRLLVRVEDDGRGFDPSAPSPDGHLGLRVLRDGVQDVGGSVDLRRRDQGGTVLEARLPLEAGAVAA